jgi:hypothetical protein
MSLRLSPTQLDEILALQLTVAWAGEAAGEPSRLGWWRSDLVDPEAGGDLFARVLPRTAPWASLALVRDAARRVDEAAREKLARGDAVWSLFHLGYSVDEQLADRLAQHRHRRRPPPEVLGARFLVGRPWSKDAFESMLAGLGKPKVQITLAGRRLDVTASSPVEAAALLAAALLPLSASYPLPFIEGIA